MGLQTKLKINEAGDIYEQEADRIADQVVAASGHHVVSSAVPRIQRFAGQPVGQAELAPASVDRALASPGRPLDPALRQDMEQRFGHDFSRVRVHSGAAAERSARDVNAHAYTVGHSIVFGSGQFAPGTQEGRRLLAHELTHLVQQSVSDVVRGDQSNDGLVPISQPLDSSLETRLPFVTSLDVSVIQRQAPDNTRHQLPSSEVGCSGYEPNEVQVSHTEAGHLENDVIHIAPGRLLIADFGVDWRHVKRTTMNDLVLRSMIGAFEVDDSYRLDIIGYSDCVGIESSNTELRQGRSRRVEDLLGPRAKSRITFRGMAALGEYVADNRSVTGRAKNRGVVIQFQIPSPRRQEKPAAENCRALVGDCDFYKCRERRHPCGATGYYLGYGYKYCDRFTHLLRPRLSVPGQRWVDQTRRCLMEHVDRHIPLDAPCDEVKRSAFDSHPSCYVHGGICFLDPGEWKEIIGVIDSSDMELQQTVVTGIDCLGNWGALIIPGSLGAGGGLRGLMERDRRRVFGF